MLRIQNAYVGSGIFFRRGSRNSDSGYSKQQSISCYSTEIEKLQRIYEYLTQGIVTKLCVGDSEFEKNVFRITDPRVRKALDPVSATPFTGTVFGIIWIVQRRVRYRMYGKKKTVFQRNSSLA
jgi:hypothetical protein